MPQEIERKFLVKNDSFKEMTSHFSRIVQGYISSCRGATVRVRIKGTQGFLTIKGSSDAMGMSRYEWEKEIPLQDAEELMLLCEPGAIDKVRYFVPYGNHIYEVDEFHGANEGLIVAEIELSAVDEKFDIAPFIGTEVTGDVRYYNSFLTKHPFKEW